MTNKIIKPKSFKHYLKINKDLQKKVYNKQTSYVFCKACKKHIHKLNLKQHKQTIRHQMLKTKIKK